MTKIEELFKLSVVLVIFGIIVILASGWSGNVISNIWINSVGGSADTNTYEFQRYTYTASIRAIGTVLFAVGLAAMLVSSYKRKASE